MHGDCAVHLHAFGASQGESCLRLTLDDLKQLGSRYLLDECLYMQYFGENEATRDGNPTAGEEGRTLYELYISAPPDLGVEQAHRYNLTTRNFFAYAASRPVIGERLGDCLFELLERVRAWQPQTAALANFMLYCERQSYLDLANNVDNALACLSFAEQAHLKDLWIDAFAHTVGMQERVDASPECTGLSNTTRALLSRASLEEDLHIARVTRALGSFLEEELSTEHLGLSKPARDHLDRFRSCLHAYYVDKLGYFPPSVDAPYNKRLWTKMYHAFQTLYEYLVDTNSSTDLANNHISTGGVYVSQNVKAFDDRNGYTPLPHPLPLLPESPTNGRTVTTQKGLRSFRLGSSDSAATARFTEREALSQASNSGGDDMAKCELVQEYQRFEKQKLEERLSLAEARKVRWLLIYSTLQMLISITRAPKEVRDTDSTPYPLCVLLAGGPNWLDSESDGKTPTTPSVPYFRETTFAPQMLEQDEERLSIHPDCEAESADEYFASSTISRSASELSLSMTPPPLRITTQLSKTASIRSSVHSGVHALHRSMVGSLSKRSGSIRRSSLISPLSKSNSFSEILVTGYGNGADGDDASPQYLTYGSVQEPKTLNPLAAFDFGLEEVNEEPVLEESHLDDSSNVALTSDHASNLHRSPSDSSASAMTSDNGSARSSEYLEYDSPTTEPYSWNDISPRNSDTTCLTRESSLVSHTPSLQHRFSYQRKHIRPVVRANSLTIVAGVYTPTGLRASTPSKLFHDGEQRRASLAMSSSLEGSQMQAHVLQARSGSACYAI